MADPAAVLIHFYASAAEGFSVTATTCWHEAEVDRLADPGRKWHAHGLVRPFATPHEQTGAAPGRWPKRRVPAGTRRFTSSF